MAGRIELALARGGQEWCLVVEGEEEEKDNEEEVELAAWDVLNKCWTKARWHHSADDVLSYSRARRMGERYPDGIGS